MSRRPVWTLAPLALASTLLLGGSGAAHAAPGPFREAHRFGLGLGAGTSTAGLSAKYFLSDRLALQGVIGAGYDAHHDYYAGAGGGWDSGAALSADLLFEMPAFFEDPDVNLAWAIGPGMGIWVGNHSFALAASGALGFEVNITAVPLDIVIEYRPRLLIVPPASYAGDGLAFDFVNFSGHIRYYF